MPFDRDYRNFLRVLIAGLMLGCGAMSAARADEEKDPHESKEVGKIVQFEQVDGPFQKECSSCHIAYPPGMLPTESWRKIMNGLDDHFGTDASLAPEDVKKITDFLVENTCDFWGMEMAPLRVTETDWFHRVHNSFVIAPEVWQRPAVKSPAHCTACHREAEKGDFSEHNIHIPE